MRGAVIGLMAYPSFVSLTLKVATYPGAVVTVPVPVEEGSKLLIGDHVDVDVFTVAKERV